MGSCIGVDGCRAGWLAISLDPAGGWHADVYQDIATMMAALSDAERVLLDMPIGLPHDHNKRSCDQEARRILTHKRSSSVFPVPARVALAARDYLSASDANQTALGVRLTKQAWNILPKIREVDEWMQVHDPQHQVLRECHPELAFWGMAGKPMDHPKRSPDGAAERLRYLTDRYALAPEVYTQLQARYPRKHVAGDDILDALCLAITARYAPEIYSLPALPEYDAKGLRMEICYGNWGK